MTLTIKLSNEIAYREYQGYRDLQANVPTQDLALITSIYNSAGQPQPLLDESSLATAASDEGNQEHLTSLTSAIESKATSLLSEFARSLGFSSIEVAKSNSQSVYAELSSAAAKAQQADDAVHAWRQQASASIPRTDDTGFLEFTADSFPTAPDLSPILAAPPASVSMRACRLQLLNSSKLHLVAPAIAAMPSPQREAAEIEWEYSFSVKRSSPLVALLAPVIGLTTESEIDQYFIDASTL